MTKRFLAMLLCLAMLLSVVPTTVLATEIEEPVVLETLAEEVEETTELVEETTEVVEETTEVVEETTEAVEETVEAVEETTEAVEETTEAVVEPAEEETLPEETVPEETVPQKEVDEEKRAAMIARSKQPVERMQKTNKTKKHTEIVRKVVQNQDGSFSYRDEAVTREEIIPSMEWVSKEAANSIRVDTDEWGDTAYFFTTFEDLKQLVADHSRYTDAYYEGEEPLVISEDIALPNGFYLYSYDNEASVVISEGVTMQANSYVSVNNLQIAGTFCAYSGLSVSDSLSVSGNLELYDELSLMGCTVSGAENISLYDEEAYVYWETNCDTAAKLVDACEAVAALPEDWDCYIYINLKNDITLTQSITIPKNAEAWISYSVDEPEEYEWMEDEGYQGGTLKIPAGCTMTVNGGMTIGGKIRVDGSFVNNSRVQLMGYEGYAMEFGKNGTYSGVGELMIAPYSSDENKISDFLIGLDMSKLHVVEGFLQCTIYDKTSVTILADPTNLTWHKNTDWDENGQILVDQKGNFVWKTGDPTLGNYEVAIYGIWKDEEGYSYEEYYTGVSYGFENPEDMPEWLGSDEFVLSSPDSGKYYFCITNAADYDTAGYASSNTVKSGYYTYKKPSAKCAAPTNLKLEERIPSDWYEEETLCVSFDAATPEYAAQWYYGETPIIDFDDDTVRSCYSWGESNSHVAAAPSWFLEECGPGYYYCEVRSISDNIEKKCNSDWSAISGPYRYYGDVEEAAEQELLKALETASDAASAREAAQEMDQELLNRALKKANEEVLKRYKQLEKVAGGAAQVEIASDFTAFEAENVSVLGANLNTPDEGQTIALSIGKAEKTHTLTGDLNSPKAVHFSMKLKNVAQQTVPVLVTLPIPAGIDPAMAVVLHHTAGGYEVLVPISYTQDTITLLLNSFSDFTITEDVFTEAEFLAEYNAALNAGKHSYELNKPVVLSKNTKLACGDDNFRLSLVKGGSITIPKGVTCTLESCMRLEDKDSAITVEGTLIVKNDLPHAEFDVVNGTCTIAEGGRVDTAFIVLYLNSDASLTGWTDEKTYIVAEIDTVEELRTILAQNEKYYALNVRLGSETPLALNADLTISDNAAVGVNDTDFTIASGAKLINDGQLSVDEGNLTVEAGAEIVNHDWMSIYGASVNMQGSYNGLGSLYVYDSTINGGLIQVEFDHWALSAGEEGTVTAKVFPEDSNAELVWTVESGSDYITLIPNGNSAKVIGKASTTQQTVTVKVATADGTASNTFPITIVEGHEYEPVVIPSTYTQKGYTAYVCDCGDWFIDDSSYTKAKGLPKPSVTISNDAVTGDPILTWEAKSLLEGVADEADAYKVCRATSKKGKYSTIATVTEPTYQDTGASAGKTYYYKVIAVCSANSKLNSSDSPIVSAYSKCAAPVATASANASSGKPYITWGKVSGASKYYVYRVDAEGNRVSLGYTTKTYFTDSKATVGTTYTYQVRAYGSKSSYNGTYSESVTCLCICGQPAVSISISSTTGKPTVSWKAVSGAVSYDIYRSTNGTDFELLTNQTAVSYADTAAAPDTDYWYKVNAIAAEETLNSVEGAGKKVHTTLAKPAVTFGNDEKTGRPKLTWEAVEGAVSYQIYRSSYSTKKYKAIATVTGTEYTNSVSVGKGYYYKVIAVGANSSSAYSSYKKLYGKCAQPDVTVTTNSSGKPYLKWGKVTSAKKYYVYRVNTETGALTSLGTTTKTYYTDSKAAVGTTYTYQVRAYPSKSTYKGAYSEIDSCLCICGQPAVSISISSTTGKPTISWKAISGAVSYDVYRSANGTDFELLMNQTGTSYADADVTPDTDYWYKVNALAAEDANSSVEGIAKKVHTTLAKPVVTFGNDEKTGKPKLTWEAVEGAVSYEIYRSSYSSKKYKAIKTVTDTEYTDTSVSVGKGYYYKVIAVGANSSSAYSSYKKLYGKCAQPVVTVTQSSNGKPYLKWGKVTSAKKYDVYRVDMDGNRTKLGTTTKTYYTDSKAAAGTSYYYQVRAISSKSSYSSTFSESMLFECEYVVNTNTGKFHYPACSSADDINEENRWEYKGTREELLNQNYVPCKKCSP